MHLIVPKNTLRGTGVGFQAPSPAFPSQDLVPVEEWSGRAADVFSLASAGAVGSVYKRPGLPRLPALPPPGSPCSSQTSVLILPLLPGPGLSSPYPAPHGSPPPPVYLLPSLCFFLLCVLPKERLKKSKNEEGKECRENRLIGVT